MPMKRNSLENLTFEPSFFTPEVREGFYISEMIKRHHAAQLSVLAQIDRVCRKYNLRWYADNGTLLGCIRHGGYIPWDDDIDICMMRADMERLLDVAGQELPEEYQVLNVRRNGYEYLIAQITNGLTIGLTGERLQQSHGCPYIVGIDIFAMDDLYDDPETEEARCKKAALVIEALTAVKDGLAGTRECRELIDRVERTFHRRINRKKHTYRDLLVLAEDIFSEHQDPDARRVAHLFHWALKRVRSYEKAWFGDAIQMPFENTWLPVPERYDHVLKTEFRDFMRVIKGTGTHEYPVYDNQEQLLLEQNHCHTGRYTLRKEHLLNHLRREKPAAPPGEKKEIVFLPVKADWWSTMKPFWEKACADPDVTVTVIAVPYLEADPDGGNPRPVFERDLFPPEVELTDPSAYDFGIHHPDTIVIQHPYDEWSFAVHLPAFFRSGNVRGFTKELVYIPCHDAASPAETDELSKKALQVLIEQPAVVNADIVVVKDERMRNLYLETLTRITGEDTLSAWSEKIRSEWGG